MRWIRVNSDLDAAFFFKDQIKDNLTIAANADDYFTFTDLPLISGYTRIMVTTDINNATTSGTQSSYVSHYTTTFNDTSTIVNLRNFSTTSAKVKINVRVLYVKDTYLA